MKNRDVNPSYLENPRQLFLTFKSFAFVFSSVLPECYHTGILSLYFVQKLTLMATLSFLSSCAKIFITVNLWCCPTFVIFSFSFRAFFCDIELFHYHGENI